MGASGEIFRAKKRGKEHMKEQQKKKAAPVLVVLILIVLVGAAGVVSFLINRYKPGTEYMAGNEYFNLTDENSVALIRRTSGRAGRPYRRRAVCGVHICRIPAEQLLLLG